MSRPKKLRVIPESKPPAPDEFEALVRVMPDGIVVVDSQRRFVDANLAFLEMTEYSLEELRQRDFTQITPPQYAALDQRHFEEVVRTGRTGPFRKQYLKKSGVAFWVEIAAVQTVSPDGVKRIWTSIKNVDDEVRHVSLLQATIEATADGILVVDCSGKIIIYNRKFAELWNLPEYSIQTTDDERQLSYVVSQLNDPQMFLKRVRELYATPEAESFDMIEFKNGTILERYSKPQWLGPNVVGRVWNFRDVTARVEGERVLRETEERFRALAEATFEAVFIHDQGKLLLVNKSCVKLFGYEASELVGMNGLRLVAPEWRDLVRTHIGRALEIPYEVRFVKKDGSSFWGEIRPKEVHYRGIAARVTAIRDISDRKAAEERTRQSEEEFRATFEVAAVGKAQINPMTDRFKRANQKFCEITGYSVDELLGKRFLDLIHPDDRISVYDSFHNMVDANAPPYSAERRCIRKDGSLVWLNVSIAPIRDLDRNVISTIAVFQDITEQKRAREQAAFLADAAKLLGSTLNYETTLRNVSQLVVEYIADWCLTCILRSDGTVRLVATAATPDRAELVQKLEKGRPDFNAPEGLPRALRTRQAVLYQDVTDSQLHPAPGAWPIVGTRDPEALRILRELGMSSYMAVPMLVRGEPIGGLIIASATPSRRYDERDLALASELARLCATAIDNAILYEKVERAILVRDDFISIASHELRTPLTPLKMQLQLLRRKLQAPESLSPQDIAALNKLMTDAEYQVERLQKLVENLLDISRIRAGRLTLSYEEVDLGALISELVKRFSVELEAAQCHLRLDAAREVKGSWDRARIEQVVTNLLSNAMKYGRGKPIEIRVAQEPPDAVISIVDHGIGIAAKDQAKLFGRFERVVPRKSVGGLGLGLFITRQIVEAHGGTISVTSEPGKGSTFEVRLPLKTRSEER